MVAPGVRSGPALKVPFKARVADDPVALVNGREAGGELGGEPPGGSLLEDGDELEGAKGDLVERASEDEPALWL